MTPVLKLLEDLSTGYNRFERDQVLTHEQLNSLADYADDQTRLTRATLLGVGLVAGLKVELTGGQIELTTGLGVTTDGDLLHIDAARIFTRYRQYDSSRPAYPPLYEGEDIAGTMRPAWELLPASSTGPQTRALSQFAADTGRALTTTTAVLLVESHAHDEDICTGMDCDNKGQQVVNPVRLLLIRQEDAGALAEVIPTPRAIYSSLSTVRIDRPTLTTGMQSSTTFRDAFRSSCANARAALVPALTALFGSVNPFTSTFDADPQWGSRLSALVSSSSGAIRTVQSTYGFLKDLADTYHEAREALFEDIGWLHDDVEHFPKHLLLGNLSSGSQPRTGYYPSPLWRLDTQGRRKAGFMLARIEMMIDRFAPLSGGPIRVTPSAFEDRPLGQRAIPAYFQPGGSSHRRWSYALERRGRSNQILSYHAADWSSDLATTEPLGVQIGQYPFFRVEGHIGVKVTDAMTEIEALIAARNLPFGVKAVFLGSSRSGVTIKPHEKTTDLDYVRHVFSEDLMVQLDEVARFSAEFKSKVDQAVDSHLVSDESSGGIPLKERASTHHQTVQNATTHAKSALSSGAANWGESWSTATMAAGSFRYQLGHLAKTEFSTPFDHMIAHNRARCVVWMGQLRQVRREQDEDRLVFSNFITEHPGLEHFGGVMRGGTLVLVYNSAGEVVADLMLPYSVREDPTPAQDPPDLDDPGLRDPWIAGNGIRILPPFEIELERFIEDDLLPKLDERFIELEGELIPRIDDRFQIQEDLAGQYQEILTLISTQYRDMLTQFTQGLPGTIDQRFEDQQTRFQDLLTQVGAEYREMLTQFTKDLPGAIDQRFEDQQTSATHYQDLLTQVGTQYREMLTEITTQLPQTIDQRFEDQQAFTVQYQALLTQVGTEYREMMTEFTNQIPQAIDQRLDGHQAIATQYQNILTQVGIQYQNLASHMAQTYATSFASVGSATTQFMLPGVDLETQTALGSVGDPKIRTNLVRVEMLRSDLAMTEALLESAPTAVRRTELMTEIELLQNNLASGIERVTMLIAGAGAAPVSAGDTEIAFARLSEHISTLPAANRTGIESRLGGGKLAVNTVADNLLFMLKQ